MSIKKEGNFLYHDLSYKLVGLAMEIHREYGPAHNERIYHNIFKEKLTARGINYLSKPKIVVYSKDTGKMMGYYEPDLVVDERIIIELKATAVAIRKHEIQILEYIKTSNYELGYLFNFGLASLYYKRIIYTNNNKLFLNSVKEKN